MRFFLFAIFFVFAIGLPFAQPPGDISKDTTDANMAVLADVNIFSQMPLGSIYILWSNLDISADIIKKITNHSFVLEPYYMQNIDREQFEQNQILQLFAEQRKAFFKLFPEEDEE
jgi:hypothetical protein